MKLKFRHVLLTTTLLGAAVVTACDGDDTMQGGNDASVASDASVSDQSSPPVDAKADARIRGNQARLHFVNDNITLDDGFRYCVLAADGTTEPTINDVIDVVPFPSQKMKGAPNPGLSMGRVSEAPELLPSYEGKRLKVLAYDSNVVNFKFPNTTCKQLLAKSSFRPKVGDGGAGDGGVSDAAVVDSGGGGDDVVYEGFDFSVFDFPAGTFADKKSYAIIQTGCPAGTDPGILQRCGLSHDNAKGSLGLYVVSLDGSAAPAGKQHLQGIHGAKRMLSLDTGAEPKMDLVVEYPTPDAGESIVADIKGLDYNSTKALPVPPVVAPNLSKAEFLYFKLALGELGDNMPRILEVSEVTKADLEASDQKGFTFIVLGSPLTDPEISPGVRNHLYIHAVLVPNQ